VIATQRKSRGFGAKLVRWMKRLRHGESPGQELPADNAADDADQGADSAESESEQGSEEDSSMDSLPEPDFSDNGLTLIAPSHREKPRKRALGTLGACRNPGLLDPSAVIRNRNLTSYQT
jgi:hypothetical protein